MCGIFGIASSENGNDKRSVLLEVVFGLYDLQHRGEQGCGIAISDGARLRYHRAEGLVT